MVSLLWLILLVLVRVQAATQLHVACVSGDWTSAGIVTSMSAERVVHALRVCCSQPASALAYSLNTAKDRKERAACSSDVKADAHECCFQISADRAGAHQLLDACVDGASA